MHTKFDKVELIFCACRARDVKQLHHLLSVTHDVENDEADHGQVNCKVERNETIEAINSYREEIHQEADFDPNT